MRRGPLPRARARSDTRAARGCTWRLPGRERWQCGGRGGRCSRGGGSGRERLGRHGAAAAGLDGTPRADATACIAPLPAPHLCCPAPHISLTPYVIRRVTTYAPCKSWPRGTGSVGDSVGEGHTLHTTHYTLHQCVYAERGACLVAKRCFRLCFSPWFGICFGFLCLPVCQCLLFV